MWRTVTEFRIGAQRLCHLLLDPSTIISPRARAGDILAVLGRVVDIRLGSLIGYYDVATSVTIDAAIHLKP